jgi:hypothetical protein
MTRTKVGVAHANIAAAIAYLKSLELAAKYDLLRARPARSGKTRLARPAAAEDLEFRVSPARIGFI